MTDEPVKMYIDILLEEYGSGKDFSDILGSECNPDRLASEIVGMFRTRHLPGELGQKGLTIPLLKAVTSASEPDYSQDNARETGIIKGVTHDGHLYEMIKTVLEDIAEGVAVVPSIAVQQIIDSLHAVLGLPVNLKKLKSALKTQVQAVQLEMLEPSAKLSTTLKTAFIAAYRRNSCKAKMKNALKQ